MSGPTGREDVLGALAAGGSVLIAGGRGTGRTAVLAEAARRFTAAGGSVLATRVLAGDGAVPLAALQRLLAPVRDRAVDLPPDAKTTLDSLFGTGGPDHGPVPSAGTLARAVGHLTAAIEAEGRWLWCVDDLDRCDPASASVITTSGVPVLATAVTPPPGLAWPVVRLNPLPRTAAAGLLAGLPGAASHPAAHVVLAQAGGNPLALVELARTLPPAAGLPATVTELPVPARLRGALAPAVAQLEPAELDAAVLAALAVEAPAREPAGRWDQLVAPDVWDRLISAGIVRPGRRHRPSHPVVRAAVLDRAGPAAQQEVRRRLAAHLDPAGPAYAWHRARGGQELTAAQATALEHAGHALAATGRLRPAAYALAMAAEHTPPSPVADRRRDQAVHCALSAGEVAWADRIAAGGVNPGASIIDLVGQAWLRGDDRSRAALRSAVNHPRPAWVEAITDDADPGGRFAREMHQDRPHPGIAQLTPAQQWTMYGVMALSRHETTQARRYLLEATDLAPGAGYQLPIAATALAWAEFDAGELDRADRTVAAALRNPAVGGEVADLVRAGAFTVRAAVALLQERDDREERLRDVLDGPVAAAPAHEQRLIRARGQADAIAGDFDLAFRRLRRLYDDDGQPVHYRVSDLGLADLVSAAVTLDRAGEVTAIVAAAEPRVRALGSLRLTAIWQRARALLAGRDAAAETHYRLALDDPGTGQWPVERAAAAVDYARWLRRGRRPAESRALLESARDAFAAARLPAWRARADSELAAAAAPAHRDVTAQLTPQQREVVRLAAQGLTNQQIATRLALSPRTVSTHLARAFPVLGVTRRAQLRAVLDPPG
ncbi:helix-turn-helix transcriptional regulator [Paractinoplanes maris]|uniref:helix-turn-helix transcriptional regulator n=1 Tax=Paractinoplanes maris TaxID=1734446 RepID=UPI0024C3E032|nr:LuxR family transcriptional regulator [Actinoplanes maris]